MVDLAVAMSRAGCNITYVAENLITSDRVNLGWSTPNLNAVALKLVNNKNDVHKVISNAPINSIHICQGLRSNSLVGFATSRLIKRGLRYWIIMETVDDSGYLGLLKRFEYFRLFMSRKRTFQGVLAIGYKTGGWVLNRGVPAEKIFPFTYFLKKNISQYVSYNPGIFRFIFVGNLIERKRLNILIEVLSKIKHDFELIVVGQGELESKLKEKADALLSGKVKWLGVLPMNSIPMEISKADCLVLPSRHDGWGVVVSEAIMVGTQVICSDACGAAGVVNASRCGGVFMNGNLVDLEEKILQVLNKGKISDESRRHLMEWGECLSADSGANYLLNVLNFTSELSNKAPESWLRNRQME